VSSSSTDLEADKKAQRRIRQNQATQEYRKRRRLHLDNLENTVSILTKQLEQAKQELSRFQNLDFTDLILPNSDFLGTCEEGKTIVLYIRESLSKSQDDLHQLQHLLSLFWTNMELINMHLESQIDKMVNPFMQYTLSMFGFHVATPSTPVVRFIPSAPWWPEFCMVAALTQEQRIAIETIKAVTCQTELAVWHERVELNNYVRNMLLILKVSPNHVNFTLSLATPPEANINGMRELKQKLDLLKANYVMHFKLIVSAHRQIGALLTARQHAMLVVRAFPTPPYSVSLENFRRLWDIVSHPPPQ